MADLKLVKGVPPTPPTQTVGTGTALLGCLAVLFAVIVHPILNGLALSVLWGWFVVKLFGLPAIGKAAAIGLSLVAQTFVGTHNLARDKTESKSVSEAIGALLGHAVLTPIMLLLSGYIVTLFM